MFDCISLELAPPIVMNIYDTDCGLFDSKPDFLGRSVIHLTDIGKACCCTPKHEPTTYRMNPAALVSSRETANVPPAPHWYGVRPGYDQNVPK
jgi:hypothetical protein